MNTQSQNPMTLQSKQRGSGLRSRSLSEDPTSVHTLSGFLSRLLLAWLSCVLAGLFVWSSEVYEAFTSLPVKIQFAYVAWASLFAVGYAVTMREIRKDCTERWAARTVGAAGVLFLVAFSYRMTLQVDQLQNQLAARDHGDDETHSAVAHQIGVMVAPKVYSVRTHDGLEISWNGTDRGAKPVSITDRRGGVHHGADFATGYVAPNAGSGVGAMSFEQSRLRTTLEF